MRSLASPKSAHVSIGSALLVAAALVLPATLTGCIVAGYSSGGGLWVWPGSLVVTLILVLLYFMLRRR